MEKVSIVMHSHILHAALLKQALLLSEMQASQRILFVSYRLSTMPTVVTHDIFPWSPVSTYKSQQCCQNSRTASAESICKVSSWAIASSWALTVSCDLVLPLASPCHTKLFTAVLRITLLSHQSASINSGHYTVQKKLAFPPTVVWLIWQSIQRLPSLIGLSQSGHCDLL